MLDFLVRSIQGDPELARRKFMYKSGNHYDLPFHHLCNFNPTLDQVKAVYEAYPSAILKPGMCNLLPLHAYIAEVLDAEIIEFLVNEYPQGLLRRAYHDMTPIHLLHYSNFTAPDITQVLVKRMPEAVMQRCELGTTLQMALNCRHLLEDEADLFLNEESLKIMAENCPSALKVVDPRNGDKSNCEYKVGEFEIRQLPLSLLLNCKPTPDLVDIFVTGFSAALRFEALSEDGSHISILQSALSDPSLTLDVRRALIRGSAVGHKMAISLCDLSAEIAIAILEEADAHPMVDELEITINSNYHVIGNTTHTAMMKALRRTTTLKRFWYVPNASTTKRRLPDVTNHLLSDFFAQNTPLENLKIGLSFHSSAFEGLSMNSNIQELKVNIQRDSTDDLGGLATALKDNNTVIAVTLHTLTIATPWPLLELFLNNTILERFCIYGPSLPAKFCDSVLDVLATRNTTLLHVVSGIREERIDHYCALNRTGRSFIRKSETTKAEFVDLIHVRIDNVNILYGLLLDVPSLWSA